ncbi:MAG TPA: nitroreductase family deazaflavin-dependent oxidoreductase [Thermoleophilaceae bacterium]
MSLPAWQRPLVKIASSRGGSWYFLNVATPIDRRLIPATRGRLSSAPGKPVCVVETVGARSGQPRRIPLLYAHEGDDLILIASSTGAKKNPAWFHNIRKNPSVRVWAPRGRSGEYVARVAEGAERERLWNRANELYPGYETYDVRSGSREIPVVALSPRRSA